MVKLLKNLLPTKEIDQQFLTYIYDNSISYVFFLTRSSHLLFLSLEIRRATHNQQRTRGYDHLSQFTTKIDVILFIVYENNGT